MAILVEYAKPHGVTGEFIGNVIDNQYSNSLTTRPFPEVSSSKIVAPLATGANNHPGGKGR